MAKVDGLPSVFGAQGQIALLKILVGNHGAEPVPGNEEDFIFFTPGFGLLNQLFQGDHLNCFLLVLHLPGCRRLGQTGNAEGVPNISQDR